MIPVVYVGQFVEKDSSDLAFLQPLEELAGDQDVGAKKANNHRDLDICRLEDLGPDRFWKGSLSFCEYVFCTRIADLQPVLFQSPERGSGVKESEEK